MNLHIPWKTINSVNDPNLIPNRVQGNPNTVFMLVGMLSILFLIQRIDFKLKKMKFISANENEGNMELLNY